MIFDFVKLEMVSLVSALGETGSTSNRDLVELTVKVICVDL